MERVAVVLHLKDRETGAAVRKVWRFQRQGVETYTRAGVQAELVQMFQDIQRRGLQLDLWYTDDLVGEVS